MRKRRGEACRGDESPLPDGNVAEDGAVGAQEDATPDLRKRGKGNARRGFLLLFLRVCVCRTDVHSVQASSRASGSGCATAESAAAATYGGTWAGDGNRAGVVSAPWGGGLRSPSRSLPGSPPARPEHPTQHPLATHSHPTTRVQFNPIQPDQRGRGHVAAYDCAARAHVEDADLVAHNRRLPNHNPGPVVHQDPGPDPRRRVDVHGEGLGHPRLEGQRHHPLVALPESVGDPVDLEGMVALPSGDWRKGGVVWDCSGVGWASAVREGGGEGGSPGDVVCPVDIV